MAQGQYYMVADYNYHNGSATRNYAVVSAKTRAKAQVAKESVSPSAGGGLGGQRGGVG